MIFFRSLFISFVLLYICSKANSSDIEIIELHKNKTLDQLVLDNKEQNADNGLKVKNNSEINETFIEVDQEELSNQEEVSDIDSENEENITLENVSEDVVSILKSETIFDLNYNLLNNHLNTITDIKSKTLQREFIRILSNQDFEEKVLQEDKLYLIITKLYELGELQKAYDLVKKVNLNDITNTTHLNFFYFIELNYLYSSFKLSKVCELKSFLLENEIFLPSNLLEKTDIFCLTLENKYAEAKLLNSLLLESELEADLNFQNLLNYMILSNQNNNIDYLLSEIKYKDLIFLYSAMLRINDLPLDEAFIEVDPLNLSIPVILSESTKMDVRIKAANRAYYDEVLSIDSLSALYQSVDFNAKQFNDPDKTILSINNNELIMAYYYQLVNIQIFPDERLDVILKYWNFAKSTGLEKIAYAITEKILDTFTPASENAEVALEIAFAHIANNKFDDALKWINLYEISNLNNESLEYAKFLIDLNINNDLDTVISYLSSNYSNFENKQSQNALETLYVLIDFLGIKNIFNKETVYMNITDVRPMPSYFLINDINYNINTGNDLSVFLLSLISMNNNNWIDIHPEHLRIILNSYKSYNNEILIKFIILEILKELEIF